MLNRLVTEPSLSNPGVWRRERGAPSLAKAGDKMGPLRAPRWLTAVAMTVGMIVIALNLKVIVDFVAGG